jgi:hypothetical protein
MDCLVSLDVKDEVEQIFRLLFSYLHVYCFGNRNYETDKNWAGQVLLPLKRCVTGHRIRQWYKTTLSPKERIWEERDKKRWSHRNIKIPCLVVEQTRNSVRSPSLQLTRVVFVKKICQLVNRFRYSPSLLECPMKPVSTVQTTNSSLAPCKHRR